MNSFSKILQSDKEYINFQNTIESLTAPIGAIGLNSINKLHIIHSLCKNLNKKAFVIVPDEASAIKAVEDLNSFGSKALMYPRREFTFLDVEGISREFEHIRLGVLSKIIKGDYDIIVASIGASSQMTMPEQTLKDNSFTITAGEEIDIEKTINALINAGYTQFDQVDSTSQFSIRGGLIDIFPPGADDPVRIELWGDTIDSIAKFDIATQRRNTMVDSIDIIPSSEVLFKSKEGQAKKIDALASTLKGKAIKAREKLCEDSDRLRQGLPLHCNDKYLPLAYKSNTLFDYDTDLLFVCESAKCKERIENQNKLMLEDIKWMLQDGIICKGIDKFNLDFEDIKRIYENKKAVYLDSFARGSFDTPVGFLSTFKSQSFNAWGGTLSQLKDELYPLI